ncbi:MAG: hypothetical protein AB1801_28385, partial [Chloroflexota bacterium]
LDVDVHCTDGHCGRSTHIIINPVTEQVSHFVVKEKQPPSVERLVSVKLVANTAAEVIFLLWPYVVPVKRIVDEKIRRIPPGELAVRRGARVRATDGWAGRVDKFLVGPVSGNITHLVLQEGHAWGKKVVCIPVAQIERIEERTVHLTLADCCNDTRNMTAKRPALAR